MTTKPWSEILHKKNLPRSFAMVRGRDESGVSGTGVVLEGVIFSDGRVALRWMSTNRSTVTYDSFDDFWANHVDSHPNNETKIYFSDGAVRAQ